ncbi:DNA-directed RNA polymerase I largest subunit [Mesorhizobium escarrei]|uniref:DNA-directed RNA polymerase I largest subunit n=1 Tax=Mesorhizobium escarrei TaxID=666018 RepID=A0ABM9DIT8_9HYPH|nr:DNA-directed RNA polymerase I largest subunit [Mesorhizobium escarrei]
MRFSRRKRFGASKTTNRQERQGSGQEWEEEEWPRGRHAREWGAEPFPRQHPTRATAR